MANKKFRKSSLLIDIVISVMVMGVVIYSAFTVANSSINKRLQITKEREALAIAQNIMADTLSVGFNRLVGTPQLTINQRAEISAIENNTSLSVAEKRKRLYELPYYSPVSRNMIATTTEIIRNDKLSVGNISNYKYHVLIDPYVDENGVQSTTMCKITVRVFYPIKVTKYDTSPDTTEEDSVKDKALKEDDYRYVELFTYKTAKQ